MMQLITGQKAKFTDINLSAQFTLITTLAAANHTVIDVACFGLTAEQKLASDDYMTFYNQPTTPCGAVRLHNDGDEQRFEMDISKLPEGIDYLVLTATIDAHAPMQTTMSTLAASSVRVEQAGQVVAEYAFDGQTFASERAIMLLQVYRKKGVWRINAIGQGFNGGLSALVTHFGGEVADDTPSQAPQNHSPVSSSPQPTSPSDHPTANGKNAPINLKKVTLDKPGSSHRVNLQKGDGEQLVVEAIWVDNGDASDDNDDLDLRVGILSQQDKDMRYIHAPEQVGSLRNMPYVQHQGDIKVASAKMPGKETVLVHPDIAKHYGGKVALVFSVYSAVSNGVVSIASLQPKMRMQYKDQVVECVFNIKASPKAKSRFVYTYVIGIAIIDEQGITLQHSGETSRRMSEATPRLLWKGDDISLKIDGPSMFKAE